MPTQTLEPNGRIEAFHTGEASIKQRERAIELLSDYNFANHISAGRFKCAEEF
jgi:hypothetical protein